MKKYRIFSALLAALVLCACIPPARALDTPELTCGAAILVDGDHGDILFEKNAHQRMYPASITQIMTTLLVLEAADRGELSLDDPVTASAAAIAAIPDGSSTQNIRPGEVLTVLELLKCGMVASAMEACTIIAEAVGGTVDAFVERMNRRAAELGMEDTHFVNPHGLHDPDHYTTAYDIYLMARQAMEHEAFRIIVSSISCEIPATNLSPARKLYNTNALICNWKITGYLYSRAIGIKTGSTRAAGQCLASAATDAAGRTFYCVVLGAENVTGEDGVTVRYAFRESRTLLEWGFNSFRRLVLMDESTGLREVSVTLSDKQDHVLALPVGSVERTLPTDFDLEQAEYVFDLPESLEAPVSAGQKLGTVTLLYGGTPYGTLDLVAATDVARSDFQFYLRLVLEYLGKWWVRALIALVIVLVIAVWVYVGVVLPRRRTRYIRNGRRARPSPGSGTRRRRF